MSEDSMDSPVSSAYIDYRTSLNIELEQYPAIWKLLLKLLRFDLETAFFNAASNELFEKIKLIPKIENYYFPKQTLNTNGCINWAKYNIYASFAMQKFGYELTGMVNKSITEKSFPTHFWYLTIVFDSALYIKTEITKTEFEILIGKNEGIALDYINLLKVYSSRFYTTEDTEQGRTYILSVMTVEGEPALFFIVRT